MGVYFLRLTGCSPFLGDTPKETFRKITTAAVDFSTPVWRLVSTAGQDWIQRLLVSDPKRRMKITQALAHKWLSVSSTRSSHYDRAAWLLLLHSTYLSWAAGTT